MSKNSPNWMRIVGSWTMIVSILGSIGTATVYLQSQVQSIVEQSINEHDHGYKDPKIGSSHVDLREENDKLIKDLEHMRDQQGDNYYDLVMAYWYLVGYAAADVEPLKQLKAAAAAYYRSEFLLKCKSSCSELSVTRCRKDGKPYIQDVFQAVLRENWPERAKLVDSMRR